MRITRRKLLKGVSAAGMALAGSGALAEMGKTRVRQADSAGTIDGNSTSKPRPNIVFIMADQLSAASIGCYGSGVESTPALDRLASSGVRFDRCYAHVPVCAPNRSSIFTGRCVDVHGVVVNNYNLTIDNPPVTQILRTKGYRTGGFGKFHFTCMWRPLPEDYSYYGFDESVGTEDPRWGPWLDWIEKEHPNYYDKALSTCWGIEYRKSYGREKRDMDQ